jgi:hypothetical protein
MARDISRSTQIKRSFYILFYFRQQMKKNRVIWKLQFPEQLPIKSIFFRLKIALAQKNAGSFLPAFASAYSLLFFLAFFCSRFSLSVF